MVEARRLTKIYRSRRRKIRALDEVDLHVQRGETFGLLGPNGAGKTTFVKCLLGLVLPTSGEISLFGRAATDPASRRRVGLAPETPNFPPFLSAPEIMRLHGRLSGLPPGTLEEKSRKLLEEAELADAPNRIRAFSKGMLRRLALAQSLLGDPKLLVLDEPTADLDPLGRRDVRVKLENLKEKGTTVLLNSHLLSEVERVCDRVAILNQGKVLAVGTLKELIPEGKDLETVFVELIEEARGQ